jgi:hypothetical protein
VGPRRGGLEGREPRLVRAERLPWPGNVRVLRNVLTGAAVPLRFPSLESSRPRPQADDELQIIGGLTLLMGEVRGATEFLLPVDPDVGCDK